MYPIKQKDLQRKVIAKYLYQTYNNAFTFYVLSYQPNHWEIIRDGQTIQNHCTYNSGAIITMGNLDWVTQAHKDDKFQECTVEELLKGEI